MMLVDRLAEPGAHHVCVDLRGGDIGMAQHGLYAAKVRAAFQEVRCETVPKNVGTKIVKDASSLPVQVQKVPERLAR
jgi:hypothetical protein